VQQPPLLTDVKADPGGKSVGDFLFFEAAVTDEAGNEGALIGSLLTVDLPDAAGEEFEGRLGNLLFRFGDDTLVVAGGTEYPAEQPEMQASSPQLRAVVGGTGRYVGARGEVLTERLPDGTYRHTFTLLGSE
jgi:hypothetical protein